MFATHLSRPLSLAGEAATRRLNALAALGSNDYNSKRQFHRLANRMLLQLAAVAMGLHRSEFEIHTNLGGDAVLGETTLHADFLYVQVREAICGRFATVMYRACRSRKDYAGLQNRWTPIEDLAEPARFVQLMRQNPSMFDGLDQKAIARLTELNLILEPHLVEGLTHRVAVAA